MNDSLDLNLLGIGRHSFLNWIILGIVFPSVVLTFSLWIHKVIGYFRALSPPQRFGSKETLVSPFLWWIPLLNIIGPILPFRVMIENLGSSDLNDNQKKKLKGGIRWIKTGFFVFYTLTILGYLFYYFVETNKDGHDFFLNTLFLFLIILSMGTIKLSAAFK
jgi:hypothetical protein